MVAQCLLGWPGLCSQSLQQPCRRKWWTLAIHPYGAATGRCDNPTSIERGPHLSGTGQDLRNDSRKASGLLRCQCHSAFADARRSGTDCGYGYGLCHGIKGSLPNLPPFLRLSGKGKYLYFGEQCSGLPRSQHLR
ncbi:hypothetical protein EVA_02752 [gut metagenome]|uniref:Uncharacterized protein n=1 Tax=gut metagenome TaxID=749906 RepID=J9H5E7_9ZZZZ